MFLKDLPLGVHDRGDSWRKALVCSLFCAPVCRLSDFRLLPGASMHAIASWRKQLPVVVQKLWSFSLQLAIVNRRYSQGQSPPIHRLAIRSSGKRLAVPSVCVSVVSPSSTDHSSRLALEWRDAKFSPPSRLPRVPFSVPGRQGPSLSSALLA